MSRGDAIKVIILALIWPVPVLLMLAFGEMKEKSSTDCNPHSQGVNA